MTFARARRRVSAGRAVLVAALVVVLVSSAACGSSEVDSAAAQGTVTDPAGPALAGAATSAPGVSPGTVGTVGAVYTEHEPGPRTKPVVGSDMLVSDADTLPADVVRQVAALKGVEASTTISLAQVALENKVYNVAAVDPASYRVFTGAASADLQEEWDRVAGGELAVSDTLRKELPIDKQGYLTLDVDGTEQRVHVGAYAPQSPSIDMVVNAKLGQALGMTQDNAMLIATGDTSPQTLRKPVQSILGTRATIQNLDVVAQYGLDPKAFQTAVFVGTLADAVGTYHYTPAGGGRITPDPSWVSSHIVTETVPILGDVTCNKFLFPQLKAALAEVVRTGLAHTIHPNEYGGCYNARFIAGTTTLSNHSFGLAIDINVPENERGTVGQMDRGVVAIFKRWGFTWGGDWHYTDPMHFELNRLASPSG